MLFFKLSLLLLSWNSSTLIEAILLGSSDPAGPQNSPSSPPKDHSKPSSLVDRRNIENWGPYQAWIWRSAAILPAMAAVPDMKRFWTEFSSKGSEFAHTDTLSSTFEYSLGALQVIATTSNGHPIDGEFLIYLGTKMLQLTAMGWTHHFVGRFTDQRTAQVIVVVMQAVTGAGVPLMGSLLSGLDSAGQSFQNPGPSGGAPDS